MSRWPPSQVVALADFGRGLAAGCVFLTVELAARVALAVPTLPELVQDRLVQTLPGPVFAYMLNHLHYFGKPTLFASLLMGQLLLAGLAGIVAARWRKPLVLGAILWLLTGVLLLSMTGDGFFAGNFGVGLTTMLAVAAYMVALRNFEAVQKDPALSSKPIRLAGQPVTRRQLIGGIAFLVAAVGLARVALGHLPTLPKATSSGLPEAVTAPDDFYRVSKNIFDPHVSVSGWSLRVDGMVNQTLTLSYSDVMAMPAQEDVRTLECISNEVGGDLISTGMFTGVRMADVLNLAGVQPGAQLLHFTSQDGYTENMTLEKAMDPTTLLVYLLDGQPLPVEHGYPLRVLGAGTYGMKNPKWLTQIELTTSAPEGFWEHQGWTPDAIVQTMSHIYVPQTTIIQAGVITIEGIAFAGERGIQQVEISIDNGKTWQPASLEPAQGPLTWVFWNQTTSLTPGTYDMLVRATDGTATLQTSQSTGTFPRGATGYDKIRVEVKG